LKDNKSTDFSTDKVGEVRHCDSNCRLDSLANLGLQEGSLGIMLITVAILAPILFPTEVVIGAV